MGINWGGEVSTDSNIDEEQAITESPRKHYPQRSRTDSGLKHTVSFETTGEWQASVESPGSGEHLDHPLADLRQCR